MMRCQWDLYRRWLFLLWTVQMIASGFAELCSVPVELTAVKGVKKTFTSPNYPNKYPHDVECTWRIRTQTPGDVIKLAVESSRLEKQFGAYGCAFDYVAVYDGYGTSHKKLGQWCGSSSPTYISSGSSMTVAFFTDRSYSTSGFEISYISGSEESFRDDADTSSGPSMMGMVGYLLLVLILLSAAMLAIRISLTKARCKCLERSRHGARSFFVRRPRRTSSAQGGTSGTTPEVFVLPVAPPAYEECGQNNLPPSYSSLELTAISQSVPDGIVHDNAAFDSGGDTVSVSLPPPYESVAGELSEVLTDNAAVDNTVQETTNSQNQTLDNAT